MSGLSASRMRCLITGSVSTAIAGGLGDLLVSDLLAARVPGPAAFAQALPLTCECALLGCLTWAWLATTAVVVEALRVGRTPASAGRRLPGVPAAWRRLVLLACGVLLMAGSTMPAQARPGPARVDTTGQGGDAVLAGLPMPERATDRRRSPTAAHRLERPTAGRVVRPGDTLWAIAATDLDAGARWREVYALNRAVLGPDPDLIVPGQRLRMPTTHQPVHP